MTTMIPALADVKRGYRGLSGCACGCGGEYITPAEGDLASLQQLVRLRQFMLRAEQDPEHYTVETMDGGAGRIIGVEVASRNVTGSGYAPLYKVWRLYTEA